MDKSLSMKVTNIHSRIINQPIEKVADLLSTLATPEDKVWPKEKWPKMKFKDGMKVGAKGGHGPIRYSIEELKKGESILFRFSKPNGFDGTHGFKLEALESQKSKITHTIKMTTRGIGSLTWSLGVKQLHDALAEDAMDKVENHFSKEKKKTEWSLYVKTLRTILK